MRCEIYILKPFNSSQFTTGNQQVNISCPGTKFYDEKLEKHSSVLATCTSSEDTFTVKDDEGDTLAIGLHNNQFGCGELASLYFSLS